MSGKILVTGATGNVGAEVIRALPVGTAVRAAVLDVQQAREQLGDQFEYVRFDFGDPDTFAPAFAGVDRLFLLRPPALTDVPRYIAPVVAAARSAGVRQVVFLSLQGVEHRRYLPHHKIEQVLRESGIAWTFLRCGFFMQNLNTTHRAEIQQRGEIFIPAGGSRTSFVDTRDIGAVAAHVLTSPGHEYRAYTLTGSAALTYAEVAQVFSHVLDQPIHYRNPSLPRFVLRKRREGVPWSYTLVMTMLYTMTRFGSAASVSADISALLGRAPISLRQYVQDYAAAWQ